MTPGVDERREWSLSFWNSTCICGLGLSGGFGVTAMFGRGLTSLMARSGVSGTEVNVMLLGVTQRGAKLVSYLKHR
jgi:hypothetical protein